MPYSYSVLCYTIDLEGKRERFRCSYGFRFEVFDSSELVNGAPAPLPSCTVTSCLQEVPLLAHDLWHFSLRVWRGGGGEGEGGWRGEEGEEGSGEEGSG